jgi:hypothetical protein
MKSGENYVLLNADLGNWRDVQDLLHDDRRAVVLGQNGRKLALGLNVPYELENTKARLFAWVESHPR